MIDSGTVQFIDMVVRSTVHKYVRSYGIPANQFDDAVSELWVAVIANLPRHDLAKGPPEALINVVVASKAISIVRRLRAAKRSVRTGRIDRVDTARDLRHPAPADFATTTSLRMDVAAAIASLPPDLQQLCRELMIHAVKPIAESRGVPRTTLRRDVARIREHFERRGLGAYGARAATFPPHCVDGGERIDMQQATTDMEPTARRFRFEPGVDMRQVRALADCASSIARLVHGEAAVKLAGEIDVDSEAGCATVGATGRVGGDLVRILASLATAEFGSERFEVGAA